MSAQNPFSPLNRALFCTECVMIWERVLPAVTPFLLFCGTVAVAAQWGIFNGLNGLIHLGIVAAGLSVAVSLALWQVVKFKPPSFSEINQRLAIDNDTRPEALLALRHVKTQPNLKLGKPKAGIAKGDPLALRYLLIMLSILGYLSLGPVPLSQIGSGFLPLSKLMANVALPLNQDKHS